MAHLEVRALTPNDFTTLQAMERDIFGAVGEDTLCAHYLRLCTDFFSHTCFLVFADGVPAGYLLGFMRDGEAYCTTLAVYPKFRRTRVITMLIGSFMSVIIDHVDSVRFTVKPDNIEARALHRMLGAVEVEAQQDFYGPGDVRIVSKIDRPTFERMRPKYERIGILERSNRIDLSDRADRSGPVSQRDSGVEAVPEVLERMAAE
jgi:ribosomal protein S18 acetylase RimI-like enzyme